MKKKTPKRSAVLVPATSLVLLCAVMLLLAVRGAPVELDSDPAPDGINLLASGILGQNLVSNGDFESDSAGWTWVQDASISTDTVQSGAKALKTSGADSTRFGYVWQELNFAYDTTEVSFWVYPASDDYYHFVELIANWRPGPATLITRVTLRDEAIGFAAVGTSTSIPNVLIPNAWNKITMQANSGTLTQEFYVNDSLYSTLTVPEFPMAEHLLVGDLSGSGNYGTLFYDDISITGTFAPTENIAPVAVDDPLPVFVLGSDLLWAGTNVVQNDYDANGDQLTVVAVIQGEAGIAKVHSDTEVTWEIDGTSIVTDGFTTTFEYVVTDGFLSDTATVHVLVCACAFECNIAAGKVSNPEDLDLDLLRRFRDEVLLTSETGTRYNQIYERSAFELVMLTISDWPELGARGIAMTELLQPAIRNLLDEDGNSLITQTQMDSVASFFAALSEVASDSLRQRIEDELKLIGPLEDYVGQPVTAVLESVLENPAGTAIEEALPETATGFVLEQNFPNPFVAATRIRYTLDRPAAVSLAVYDIQGRKVSTLAEGQQEQGVQTVTWNGTDDRGVAVPSGVYFVRLSTDAFQQTQRMVVVH